MGGRMVMVVLVATGCRQLLGLSDLPADASDGALPDVLATCPDLTTSCTDAMTLVTCAAVGASPVETTCAFGCSMDGTPHCAALVPSGGGVDPADLDDNAQLADITLATDGTIHDD